MHFWLKVLNILKFCDPVNIVGMRSWRMSKLHAMPSTLTWDPPIWDGIYLVGFVSVLLSGEERNSLSLQGVCRHLTVFKYFKRGFQQEGGAGHKGEENHVKAMMAKKLCAPPTSAHLQSSWELFLVLSGGRKFHLEIKGVWSCGVGAALVLMTNYMTLGKFLPSLSLIH